MAQPAVFQERDRHLGEKGIRREPCRCNGRDAHPVQLQGLSLVARALYPGRIRFIHEYVTFPRLGEKQTACVDVTVVILGPKFRPLSSGPVISRARIERLAQEGTSKVAASSVIPVAAKPEVK